MEFIATIEFEVESQTLAEKVVLSIKSDITNTSNFFERSTLNIYCKLNKIILEIIAKDFTAAKASINSCLLWVENSIQILEKYNIENY